MQFTTVDGPQDDHETYIVIDVSNIGRRTVHLQSLPFLTSKDSKSSFVIKGDWAPSPTVEEGRSATMPVLQRSLEVDPTKLKSVCVKDETGKVWKGKIQKG